MTKKILLALISLLANVVPSYAITYATLQGSQTFSGTDVFNGSVTFRGPVSLPSGTTIQGYGATAGTQTWTGTNNFTGPTSLSSAAFPSPILLNNSPGVAGQVLQSNGAGSAPSWETAATTTAVSNTTFSWSGQHTFQQSPNTPFCQLHFSSMGTTGTVNTKIVQFFMLPGGGNTAFQFISSGTCMDYSTSSISTQGSSITIRTAGKYHISFQRDEVTAAQMGVTINTLDLTTNFSSITSGRAVCSTVGGQGAGSDFGHTGACIVNLNVGDIVRLHTQGGTQAGTSAQRMNFFEITLDP